MIKEAIIKIVDKKDLTYEEAYQVMNEIMTGETSQTQTAAFLAALSTKSAKAETTDEISMSALTTVCEIKEGYYKSFVISPEVGKYVKTMKDAIRRK